MIGNAGISYSDFEIIPLFRKKVSKKGMTDSYKEETLLKLKREVARISPNVVVPLGETPFNLITQKRGIKSWRGSILEVEGWGKVISTHDPISIFKQYSLSPIIGFDLNRIKEEAEFPEVIVPNPTLITKPTFCDVERFLSANLKAEYCSFDIETINHQIDCISFAYRKEEAISIPLSYTDGTPYWTHPDEMRIWKMISEVLTCPSLKLIAQNATYDLTYLERYGIPVKKLYLDTMNAHHCIYPEFPKGLDFLISIYTKYPYHKDQSGINRWEYNALDSVTTLEVAFEIEKELKAFGTDSFYFSFVNNLILPYMKVQNGGLLIDTEKKVQAVNHLQGEFDSHLEEIEKICGKKLNPLSPKQLTTHFYTDKKIEPYLNRKTGRPTCDEEALQRIGRKYKLPEVEPIQNARSISKLKGTLSTPINCDGRMRTSYIISGTETGRLASKEHVFGCGTNLQNIPPGICREIFISKPGYLFTGGDLKQAEARVVAGLSGDANLLALYADDTKDSHSENAALMFGGNASQYPQGSKERQIAKTGTHAANYDISFRSFALSLGLSESEGKKILQSYHDLYPGIKKWHEETKRQLANSRTLVTPMGRKRRFFGRWGDSLFKEAFNYIPQSTVGDLINKGFLRLWDRIHFENLQDSVFIRLQVHDALYLEHPIELKDWVYSAMKECLEIPITINNHEVLIPLDLHSGVNWNET